MSEIKNSNQENLRKEDDLRNQEGTSQNVSGSQTTDQQRKDGLTQGQYDSMSDEDRERFDREHSKTQTSPTGQ